MTRYVSQNLPEIRVTLAVMLDNEIKWMPTLLADKYNERNECIFFLFSFQSVLTILDQSKTHFNCTTIPSIGELVSFHWVLSAFSHKH